MDKRSLPVTVVLLLSIALALLTGCVTEEIRSPRRGTGLVRDPQPVAERFVPAQGVSYRTHLIPIGTLPYDRVALPLVSPDGRFIATQTGSGPDFDTTSAGNRAMVPMGTRVEVYYLLEPASGSAGALIEPVASIDQPLLLGRSVNERGFIVEAPQADGSRWIGFVEWETGALTWLVQDEYVNAFGALGTPDSTDVLAWSRREVEGLKFELVIRRGEETWSLAEPETDFLYPTWTATGDALFAIELEHDGRLHAIFMNGLREDLLQLSQRSIRLSNNGTRQAAHQMLAPFQARVGGRQARHPQLVFFHPAYSAVGVWRPLRLRGATKVLDRESFTAAIDPEGLVVFAVGDELLAKPLDANEPRMQLANEYFIPRVTDSPHWPFLLMAPMTNRPRIRIVGMAAAERVDYTD